MNGPNHISQQLQEHVFIEDMMNGIQPKKKNEINNSKMSMNHLCYAFVQIIENRGQCQLKLQQLVNQTGMKKRRIYDFINILQGCGFMTKISQGKYYCVSFYEQNKVIKDINQPQNKEVVSTMSIIAAKVQTILSCSKQSIDFKIICSQIYEQFEIKLKIDTFRRRVYQCCKVLNILGLISKTNHKFKWIPPHQRRKMSKIQLNNQTIKIKKQRKRKIHYNFNKQAQIFNKLLHDIQTEKDFLKMTNRLKIAFDKKLEFMNNEKQFVQ